MDFHEEWQEVVGKPVRRIIINRKETDMETKKKTQEGKQKNELKGDDFIQFLKEKKARDGRLSKIGEWFLSGKKTGLYIREEDMKYILR